MGEVLIDRIANENEQMMNALALLAENRRLRSMLAASGLPPPVSPRTYLADLALIIATQYGLSVEDFQGSCRSPEINEPRQHFMWLARQAMDGNRRRWSDGQIARFLGDRDRTTVIHGARRHAERTLIFSGDNEVSHG